METDIKVCPACYEEVDQRATVCSHCGKELSFTSQLFRLLVVLFAAAAICVAVIIFVRLF